MTVWGPGMPKYGREGRPKRKRTVSSVKKSCDNLWSKVVKTRAGWRCERCGAEPEDQRGFQAHHVYGRKNHRLRFEPRNGTALCGACHLWAGDEPLGFAEWFHLHRMEDAAYLRRENKKGTLQRSLSDYLELEDELKALLG